MDSPYAFPPVPPDTASLLSEKCLERLVDLHEMLGKILGASADVYTRSRVNWFPNSVPEMNFYTSFIETAETTVSRCDKFIFDIDQLSKHLKSQRDAVDHVTRAAQSLLSPVRKIPLEILSQIFDIHCSAEPSLQTVSYDTVTSSTLALGHTCSFWRRSTVSRPEHWRFLRINLVYVTESGAFTDYIIEIITKSGESGLILEIEGLIHLDREDDVFMTDQQLYWTP